MAALQLFAAYCSGLSFFIKLLLSHSPAAVHRFTLSRAHRHINTTPRLGGCRYCSSKIQHSFLSHSYTHKEKKKRTPKDLKMPEARSINCLYVRVCLVCLFTCVYTQTCMLLCFEVCVNVETVYPQGVLQHSAVGCSFSLHRLATFHLSMRAAA